MTDMIIGLIPIALLGWVILNAERWLISIVELEIREGDG